MITTEEVFQAIEKAERLMDEYKKQMYRNFSPEFDGIEVILDDMNTRARRCIEHLLYDITLVLVPVRFVKREMGLLPFSEKDLARWPNMGKDSVNSVMNALAKYCEDRGERYKICNKVN